MKKLLLTVLPLAAWGGRNKKNGDNSADNKRSTSEPRYKKCLSKRDNFTPGSILNGKIHCTNADCEVDCDLGYSVYGGFDKTSCSRGRKHGRVHYSWDHANLGSCKTCEPLDIDKKDMEISCSYTPHDYKKCVVSCKNGQGIKPMNNDKVVVVCRCNHPIKSGEERDGKCHWQIGNNHNNIVDILAQKPQHVSNWFCAKEEKVRDKENSPTLGIEHAVASSSRLAENRIPPGLVCKKDPQGHDRIIGGMAAIPHSWPWIVNMAFGDFMCGGTILDDETVITAAHCCDGYQHKPSMVTGKIADHNYHEKDLGEEKFSAIKIILHPQYGRRHIVNDVCIVKFAPMSLSRRPLAAAACLPDEQSHPTPGTRCWTAGWGYTAEGKVAEQLQEVDLQIINDNKCMNSATGAFLIPGAMFCAGTFDGGKDACQGDSGGPLICADASNQPVLQGVTSWGIGCGKENSPGVWTKVSSYVRWIRQNMMH